jgi:SAM-dependent methyltransferase
VAPRPGERLLELAAGPGDTGFLAAPRLLPGGRLLSSDVAPEMVDAARRRGTEVGVTNVDFDVLDAAALTLPDGSFDAALCRFGLMLVPDREAACTELARVLRPGGRAALATWAESGRNPWITAGGRAAVRLGLLERPDPKAPGPFRLAAEAELRELLTGAGLEVVSMEEVVVTWRAASLDEWWDITLDTSRSLAELHGRLGPDETAELRTAALDLLHEFVERDGSVSAPGVARATLVRTGY